MKNLFTIFLLLTCTICFGQNLVPNGDFETYTSCPSYFSQINLATPWMTPSTGSPDYYNQCSTYSGTGIPNNNWGFQLAHGGDGYSGIVLYQSALHNTREYIEVHLTDTLKANDCYHFEMYANLGNNCSYTCNDIQVYFSDTIVSGIPHNGCIPVPFQINNAGANFDSLTWTLVSGDYTAMGGESYLTIGNFKYDSLSNITFISAFLIQPNAYVYIDDVSLVQIPCYTGINEPNTNVHSTIYPNPFSDEFSIQINNYLPAEIILYDVLSRKVLHRTFTNSTTIYTEQLRTGIYIYKLRNSNGVIRTGKLVKQ